MKMNCLACLFLVLLAGCGEKRETSTPAGALLGHWRTRDGEELYLSPGGTSELIKAVVVAPDGGRKEFEYRVHGQDVKEGKITLYPGSKLGLLFIKGSFTDQFKTFSGTVGNKAFVWEYVDDRREP